MITINDYWQLKFENKSLQEKLDIAVNALESAASFLTCMDDLSEITGVCNEQKALEVINAGLEKIKELN